MSDLRTAPYSLEEPETSIGDLVSRLADDLGALFRDHVDLAKEENPAEAKQAATGAGLVTGGALAGWIALLMLTIAGAWGLAEAFEVWLSFLIVGLSWLAVAMVLAASGRSRLSRLEPAPTKTLDELREDQRWLRERAR